MALVTVQQIKDYLRIEEDAEDALLADLETRAEALIQTVVGQSLTSETVAWKDNVATLRLYDAPTNLLLQSVPIDEDTVVVTDGNGDTVDPDTYEIRQDLGMICAKGFGAAPVPGPTVVFDAGPYTIACTAGLATGATYATVVLPFLQMAVIDVVAMLYQQRTLGAVNEGAAGTRVTYEVDEATGLPKRIARQLRKLRGIVASQSQ